MDTCIYSYLSMLESPSSIVSIDGIVIDSDSNLFVEEINSHHLRIDTKAIMESKLYADMIPVIAVATNQSTKTEDESKEIYNILVYPFNEDKPDINIEEKIIEDAIIFWTSRINDLQNLHRISTTNARRNIIFDSVSSVDEYRQHFGELKMNNDKWIVSVQHLTDRFSTAVDITDLQLAKFSVLRAVYKYCKDKGNTTCIKVVSIDPDIKDKIIIGVVNSKDDSMTYEDNSYYVYYDANDTNTNENLIRDLTRTTTEISNMLAFMKPDESIKDTLDHWHLLTEMTYRAKLIARNSAYGLQSSDGFPYSNEGDASPAAIENESREYLQPDKKAEIIKDKFDKMLDDAGRKAGLIDAPTDPTKPIGISDSEVADIMTKLTGGNKTVI